VSQEHTNEADATLGQGWLRGAVLPWRPTRSLLQAWHLTTGVCSTESMSVAYGHYPELHALVDRLRPENADEARRMLLRLVQGDGPRGRLHSLPVFDGPEDLSERVDEYLFGAKAQEPRC
jgi:hypothetical protein